jgi:drug/metabolite transporter (DMT)-like permease
MIYILLAVVCSVLVSVLLKLAARYRVDVGQAVAWNYVVAAALTCLVFHPDIGTLWSANTPWFGLVGLGLLLPTIFLALGASVRHAGIVRSEAAQRLSLLISLLAAFLWFGDTLSGLKAAGITAGLLALLGMVWRRHEAETSADRAAWLYPLLVFAGFGVIDILFKRVAQAGLSFAAVLLGMFVLSLLVAFALQLWRIVRGATRPGWRSTLAGLLLGVLNFGNIVFYLRGHQALAQRPTLVFASMNLGVVALGAVVGMLVFGERLSRINLAGLLLALAAIGLITQG